MGADLYERSPRQKNNTTFFHCNYFFPSFQCMVNRSSAGGRRQVGVHISMPLAAAPSQEPCSNQDAKGEVSQGQPSEQDTLIEK